MSDHLPRNADDPDRPIRPTSVHLLAKPPGPDRNGAALDQCLDELRGRGVEVHVVAADTAGETERQARSLVADGAERLLVLGGDGMVHLAVQAVAGTDTVLGIVPSGTGNDFAGGLGMATDLEAAVDAALAAPQALDLMCIGERWAASVATAGFSVDVNRRANTMRRPRGSTRYTIATVLQLPRLRSHAYRLVVDGTEHDIDATVITVANTSDFGGGMRVSPAADPTDGQLDVTVVGDVGRVELLRWFRTVFAGTHLDHPKVSTLRGQVVEFSGPDLEVWADGEPVTSTPARIEAVPGALRLAGAGHRSRAVETGR